MEAVEAVEVVVAGKGAGADADIGVSAGTVADPDSGQRSEASAQKLVGRER